MHVVLKFDVFVLLFLRAQILLGLDPHHDLPVTEASIQLLGARTDGQAAETMTW